jgi:hypothetical protein
MNLESTKYLKKFILRDDEVINDKSKKKLNLKYGGNGKNYLDLPFLQD